MTTKKLLYVLIAVISLALPVGFTQVYLGAEFSELLTRSTAELSNRDVGAQLGLNLSSLGLRAATSPPAASTRAAWTRSSTFRSSAARFISGQAAMLT